MPTDLADDAGLQEYVEWLIGDLRLRADNAARRGKPTMWAYYRRMATGVSGAFGRALEQNEEAIVNRAQWIEQEARRMCLISQDASDGDKAYWYALSVYARRIMRRTGIQCRGWVRLWLQPDADDAY